MRNSVLVAIALMLAGCGAPDARPGLPPDATDQGQATTSPTPTPLDPSPSGIPLGLRLGGSACHGVGFAVEGPTEFLTGNRPGDWPPATDGTPTAVWGEAIYEVYDCERIAWDGFERGPTWIAFEMHRDFVPPESCSQGDWTRRMFLQSIWFSDQDLVHHARESYRMPALLGEFKESSQDQEPLTLQTWEFGPPGGPFSSVTQPGREDNFMGRGTLIWRLYWLDGGGVGYLDLAEESDSPQIGPGEAWGRLEEPTIYGTKMPTKDFTSTRSDLVTNLTISAPIHRFKDTQCQQSA